MAKTFDVTAKRNSQSAHLHVAISNVDTVCSDWQQKGMLRLLYTHIIQLQARIA